MRTLIYFNDKSSDKRESNKYRYLKLANSLLKLVLAIKENQCIPKNKSQKPLLY